MMVKVPEYIRTLIPYKAGKALEEIRETSFAKLASNENPHGPSPKALQAISQQIHLGNLYPDPTAGHLTRKIAEHCNVPEESIVCANGSDAVLEYAVMSFSDVGDEVLTSAGTFIGIYVIIKKLGCKTVLTPLKDWGYDLEKMASQITEKTKIIYLANPNNPTGTYFSHKDLKQFLNKVPKHVLVILDEAYVEYTGQVADYPNGLQFGQENLLVLRTFSKGYGLAGFRVGYGIGPATLIAALRKVKLPFEPSRIAQVAATAALDDKEFLEKSVKTNLLSKRILRESLQESGFSFVESIANFFMISFPTEEEAVGFTDACMKKGLYLRHLAGFGLPQCVRMNTGTEEQSLFVAKILQEIKRAK